MWQSNPDFCPLFPILVFFLSEYCFQVSHLKFSGFEKLNHDQSNPEYNKVKSCTFGCVDLNSMFFFYGRERKEKWVVPSRELKENQDLPDCQA